MNSDLSTPRVELHRAPAKGRYDAASVYAIIDAQPVCHLAHVRDGLPMATPTLAWRDGDRVYWHGSHASRALRDSDNVEVSLTFTIVDGVVFARSGFHHSINFRSAMVAGVARTVTDPVDKRRQLDLLLERTLPGRSSQARTLTEKEEKATRVQWMPIEEASVKIREGGPIDDEDDYELPIWAGVVPLATTVGEAIPDPRNLPGVDAPQGLREIRFG